MINRTLHSWSFHMKFTKLAEVSFHKFHMNSCKFLYLVISGLLSQPVGFEMPENDDSGYAFLEE